MYDRVRNIIMESDKPFFLSDLIAMCANMNITDRNVIYKALDDLCEEGLITYERDKGLIDEGEGLSSVYKYCVNVA